MSARHDGTSSAFSGVAKKLDNDNVSAAALVLRVKLRMKGKQSVRLDNDIHFIGLYFN